MSHLVISHGKGAVALTREQFAEMDSPDQCRELKRVLMDQWGG